MERERKWNESTRKGYGILFKKIKKSTRRKKMEKQLWGQLGGQSVSRSGRF